MNISPEVAALRAGFRIPRVPRPGVIHFLLVGFTIAASAALVALKAHEVATRDISHQDRVGLIRVIHDTVGESY